MLEEGPPQVRPPHLPGAEPQPDVGGGHERLQVGEGSPRHGSAEAMGAGGHPAHHESPVGVSADGKPLGDRPRPRPPAHPRRPGALPKSSSPQLATDPPGEVPPVRAGAMGIEGQHRPTARRPARSGGTWSGERWGRRSCGGRRGSRPGEGAGRTPPSGWVTHPSRRLPSGATNVRAARSGASGALPCQVLSPSSRVSGESCPASERNSSPGSWTGCWLRTPGPGHPSPPGRPPGRRPKPAVPPPPPPPRAHRPGARAEHVDASPVRLPGRGPRPPEGVKSGGGALAGGEGWYTARSSWPARGRGVAGLPRARPRPARKDPRSPWLDRIHPHRSTPPGDRPETRRARGPGESP